MTQPRVNLTYSQVISPKEVEVLMPKSISFGKKVPEQGKPSEDLVMDQTGVKSDAVVQTSTESIK